MVVKKINEEEIVEEVLDDPTEIVVSDQRSGSLSAIKAITFEQKVEIARAATNFKSIWEAIAMGDSLELDVKEIIMIDTELTDRQTGELVGKHRTTFIDVTGDAWSTTSDSVYASMCTVSPIFGPSDTWDEPIHLKFVKEVSRNGNGFVSVKF